MNDRSRSCSNCNKEFDLDEENTACPNCGVDLLRTDLLNDIDLENQPRKKPWLAILLASIGGIFGVPGIGHIYVGQVQKGIVILIIGIIVYTSVYLIAYVVYPSQPKSVFQENPLLGIIFGIMVFGYFGFWIWQKLDARRSAKDFNTYPYTRQHKIQEQQQVISSENNVSYHNDEQAIWSRNITKGLWNPQIIDTWRITNYRISAGNTVIELQDLDDGLREVFKQGNWRPSFYP